MSPVIHGLLAWFVAMGLAKDITDRRLIVIAGLAADLDGFFILLNQDYYLIYHHTLGHSYVFGILVAITAGALASEKTKVGFAAIIAFGLHLIADIFGTNWAVQPFYPLSDIGYSIAWVASGEVISFYVNFLVAAISIITVFGIMYSREISPFEFFSKKLDRLIVGLYTFWLKYKCDYCGKRAVRECAKCRRKVCFEHSSRLFAVRCTRCAGDKG